MRPLFISHWTQMLIKSKSGNRFPTEKAGDWHIWLVSIQVSSLKVYVIRNVIEFCPKFPLKSLSVQNHYRFHLLQGMVPGLDVPQLVELLRIHRGEFSIDFEKGLLCKCHKLFHFWYLLGLFGIHWGEFSIDLWSSSALFNFSIFTTFWHCLGFWWNCW